MDRRKVWNICNNVISALAVIYLTLIFGNYVSLLLFDGITKTIECTHIGGWAAFFMMISIFIVLYQAVVRVATCQVMTIKKMIDDKRKKQERKASRQKSNNK